MFYDAHSIQQCVKTKSTVWYRTHAEQRMLSRWLKIPVGTTKYVLLLKELITLHILLYGIVLNLYARTSPTGIASMQCRRRVIAINEDPESFGLAIKIVKRISSLVNYFTELRYSETVIQTVCGTLVHISIFDNNDDLVEDHFVKQCKNDRN